MRAYQKQDNLLCKENRSMIFFIVLIGFCYFQGNVGDSRAVISLCGEAEALSTDHKPVNEEEHKRITAAGGFVEFSRVNGQWAGFKLNLL